MYKTNILHKGETHENFRSVDTPVFCHAVSAKNAGKACGGSRICEYWRVGGLAALFKTFEAARHDGRHRRRTKRGYREPVRFGFFNKHLKETGGNLVPANKTGMYQGRQVTVTEHVLGGYRKGGKSNSPYTSFTINQKVAKGYGKNTIELDISALRKAIRSGEVKDIVILSPKQIERLIKNDTRQSEHWKNNGLKEILNTL